MKKLNLLVLLSIVLFFTTNFQSCKKSSLSEEDAIKLQQQTLVDYTVTLVSADKAHLLTTSNNEKSASALNGAIVKVTQGDQTTTKTADASGILAFSNLKLGTVNVNIKASGYSEINYVVDLLAMQLGYSATRTSDYVSSGDYYHSSNTTTNSADLNTIVGGSRLGNIIAMIPNSGGSMATIQGKVTYESDLTNSAPESAPANTKVIAILNGYNSNLIENQANNYIQSMSYDSLDMQGVTDASGNYTIKVPATADGLSYKLVVPDFSSNQEVIMWTMNGDTVNSAQSIPAYFGTSFTTPSDVPVTKQVNITISAPGYSYTQATATAVIDNLNGIENVQFDSNGASYGETTGANYYSLSIDTPLIAANCRPKDVSGLAAAKVYVNSDGRITSIVVNGAGKNYSATAEGAAFTIPYIQSACRGTITIAADTTLNITNPGQFLSQSMDVLEVYNINTKALVTGFKPSFTWSSNYYELNSTPVKIHGGTGFMNGSVISIRVKQSASASQVTGKLHMTKGYVSAVNITSEGANYKTGKVFVEFVGGGGIEASATATITADGRISGVTMDVSGKGKGFTSAPTVNILSTVNNVNAKATATLDADGVITGVTLKNAGSGYYTIPGVTATSAVTSIGTGAVLRATISGGSVSGVTVVTGGSGYKAKNTPAISAAPSGKGVVSSLNVQQNGTILSDIYLGTGKRTIEQ